MLVQVVHLIDELHVPKGMSIDVKIEFVEIMQNIEITFWKEKADSSSNLFNKKTI
jgi:hypothetical protein